MQRQGQPAFGSELVYLPLPSAFAAPPLSSAFPIKQRRCKSLHHRPWGRTSPQLACELPLVGLSHVPALRAAVFPLSPTKSCEDKEVADVWRCSNKSKRNLSFASR